MDKAGAEGKERTITPVVFHQLKDFTEATTVILFAGNEVCPVCLKETLEVRVIIGHWCRVALILFEATDKQVIFIDITHCNLLPYLYS